MKIIFFTCLFALNFLTSSLHSNLIYKDPPENSKFVKTASGLILGFNKILPKFNADLNNNIIITGSKSGIHRFFYKISADNKRILIDPDNDFEFDERISVKIIPDSKLNSCGISGEIEYFFDTEKQPVKSSGNNKSYSEFHSYQLFNNYFSLTPDELPQLNVTVNNSPAPGKVFLSNFPFSNNIPNTPHLIIAENNGNIHTGLKTRSNALDFKKENDSLVFFDGQALKFYQLNSQYDLIDSFYSGNGYLTDGHELRILQNEHALLMIYDSQTVDMSQIIAGGHPNCLVIGLVIQEIDKNKNVVFQWRSWDHIPITDAQHQNMTANYLDYIHGNAIDLDYDGNILISSRHLDEITKINRQTGSIIWRLGGPGNMFTFTNDPGRFYYQHGVRRLANGNIILFDNGNFHTPPYSRAVEYRLDENNMTAEMVWQYRNTPDVFGFAMGFAQRLDNGNTLISWGSANPTVTEVTSTGEKVLEMSLPQGVYTYRAFKFEWNKEPIYKKIVFVKPPVTYRLRQNYPNPFNPSTNISFELPENTNVELNIYDVTGSLVKNIVNSQHEAGYYTYQFNSSGYSSGIYFYTLKTGTFLETKKMVIVK